MAFQESSKFSSSNKSLGIHANFIDFAMISILGACRPTSSQSEIITPRLILSFLFFQINLKIAELTLWIWAFEMVRFEIVWTSWAIPRLFAIRHFPNIVKFRQFQMSKIPCIFCNFVSKLSFYFVLHHKIRKIQVFGQAF